MGAAGRQSFFARGLYLRAWRRVHFPERIEGGYELSSVAAEHEYRQTDAADVPGDFQPSAAIGGVSRGAGVRLEGEIMTKFWRNEKSTAALLAFSFAVMKGWFAQEMKSDHWWTAELQERVKHLKELAAEKG